MFRYVNDLEKLTQFRMCSHCPRIVSKIKLFLREVSIDVGNVVFHFQAYKPRNKYIKWIS